MCEVRFLGNDLCVTDLSGLFMNEAKPIAENIGAKYEYKKLMNARNMDLRILGEAVEKIFSKYSPQKIAKIIEDVDPYPGAIEFLEGIKSEGYEIYVITDNPLVELLEVKEVLKRKLPVDEIHTTSQINEETLTIEGYIPKPDVFEIIYYNLTPKPEKVLGVVQGKNDIPLAHKIKEYNGTLIVANSNSKELKKLADYHVPNTSYLPEILHKI